MTKNNCIPLPPTDEIDRFGEASVFSKLDLKTGFHKIIFKPEDIKKNAFNTKYGPFEF